MRLSNHDQVHSAKNKSPFMDVIAYQHRKSIRTSLCEHLAGMQASSRKAPATHPSDAMCLVEELHQKAEDSGGFDLDASPDSEELDLQVSEDAASVVVAALHCLGGERGAFSVTPVQVCDCSQSCTQMAKHGLSCLFLRTARSPSCVSVRKRVCFLRTLMVRFT